MKIMTLNILFGGEERFPKILEIIGQQNPDVLVLQECLGWESNQRNRLTQVAERLGVSDELRHARLAEARARGSGKRYHVGVASKLPIERWVVHNDPKELGHCIAEFDIVCGKELITIFGTHFDAHNEDHRLRETRYLNRLPQVSEGIKKKNLVLAGDLNAISPRDPYSKDFGDVLRAGGIDKYGNPPRFDVIKELESFGWVDTLKSKPLDQEWITARRNRGGVQFVSRTDYVFCSPTLDKKLKGARVVAVHGASDHEGIIAEFSFS